MDMETYYLIDYENVRGDGLKGCQNLVKSDHIIIFFTQNAKSIDMSDISNHGEAELAMIEVPAGKQSADMHIGSYIGYLVGKNGNKCKVVVVSKDTDFDKVIDFWKKMAGIAASRSQQIKKTETNSAAKPAASKEKQSEGNAAKENVKDKSDVNAEIQKALSKAGISNDIVSYVTSIAVKNLSVKNGKQQTYRMIISKYGQDKGLAIYNHIKKKI